MFGTPEYMAPEQAGGSSDIDLRFDIFALVTILYEMLVGRVPHKGETVVATLAQQTRDPSLPPRKMNSRADVSKELEQVIMTALAKDRDKRYATMGELWLALEHAAGGVPLDPMGEFSSGNRNAPGGAPPVAQAVPQQMPRQSSSGPKPAVGQGFTLPDARGGSFDSGQHGWRARRRSNGNRVLGAIIGVAGVAGVTLAIAVAMRHTGGSGQPGVVVGMGDAGIEQIVHNDHPDGGHVVGQNPPVAGDAGPVATTSADAGHITQNPVPDGGVVAIVGSIDAGTPHHQEIVPRRNLDVMVLTRPGGASLYVNGQPAGSDGQTFHRARGTTLTVHCVPTSSAYLASDVVITFDGRNPDVTCKMERKSRCVQGLHNPYVNCPE